MKRVACDLDGVVCQFSFAYAELLAYEAGGDKLPEGYQKDPLWPPVWDWEAKYGYDKAAIDRVWRDHILAKKDFWLKLDVMPGAYEAIRKLNWLVKDGEAEVYYITHRMGNNAKLQSEKWLYDRGMDFPTVIISGQDKVPLLKALGIDFYIDDKQETMIELHDTAEREKWIEGKNFYLKSAPYNAGIVRPKLTRVETLEAAMQDAGIWRE